MATDVFRRLPGGFQEAQSGPQEAAKRLQEAPKRLLRGSRRALVGVQNVRFTLVQHVYAYFQYYMTSGTLR